MCGGGGGGYGVRNGVDQKGQEVLVTNGGYILSVHSGCEPQGLKLYGGGKMRMRLEE